ncbi:PKD domain-containing protein [Natrinema altunense]|uniref:PKD domain containing protein n=1 Tax=Natrinema altunense (strain JCM 12890 / CGMCC 1.3731 / AJ2) TaxID=1227494 RepID=L9ZAT4_NATA2|nr:PKD domain-containing protein [Natrinema altunense]ELY83121.1 PKD domain containing protein [Natrinema altunense JCM 12890]
MKRSRRNVLRTASTLSAIVAGVGVGTAAAAQEYPEWEPDAVYTSGDRVVHDGTVWEAQWWTRGNEPGEGGEWGPWDEIEPYDPGPTASIAVSDASPDPGTDVQFDGTDSDGEIAAYAWDFGDGTTAEGGVVTHAYDDDGEYEVTLTVETADGDSDSTATTIHVGGRDGITVDGAFAPYQGTWGDLVDGTLAADTDRVVVSFLGDATADGDINPGWLTGCNQGSCDQQPLSTYESEIRTLQDEGIEVWLSIGGWEGRTVARDADSATELKDAYAELLDTFGSTHIDIDDENAHRRDQPIYELRNEALALLQDERPEVTVGYTVPADENGIANSSHAQARTWVRDAVEKGVDLAYVNIMTMVMGPTTYDKIVSACEGTVAFLDETYPDKSTAECWAMLGNTPDVSEESITPDVARDIVDFAADRGMGLVSYWALYNDPDGTFSEIYSDFESGSTDRPT